ncbi:MAG TPA: tetratricopeptide repeat protein [Candidatus Acidoferrales bacterium]|nr:tetratricopeptide repeat protein [Candidatus Acidoferrales bacterium]
MGGFAASRGHDIISAQLTQAQSGASSSSGTPTPAATAASSPVSTDSQSLLESARSLYAAGKLTEAEAEIRKLLEAQPDSAAGHYLLGHILFDELHRTYEAKEQSEGQGFRYNSDVGKSLAEVRDAKAREILAEFSAGAKYASPAASDLKTVGLDYVLLRDNHSAEKWLALGLKMDPKDPQGWYFLGRTRYSQDEFASAIEAFEQCLTLDPRNVLAEANVGLSYEGLGQKDEATLAYQNAIAWEAQAAAKSPEPYIYLGRQYLDQNQPDKAVPYLVQAVADFPDVSTLHEQLGKAYSTLHQLPQAQGELEKAVALAPNVASGHFLLGQVYRELGMMEKAKAELQKAGELNGTHSSNQPPR